MRNVGLALGPLLFARGCHHLGRTSVATSIHPAPGTSIIHFALVDHGIYKGSRPRSDADYAFLRSKKIKYILDLQFLPLLPLLEKRTAAKYGMTVIPAFINGSPISPSETQVSSILSILRDPHYHPIYFHCALGRDRSALIAALYKMYFMGMSQAQAWEYMKKSGFKDSWTLRGLKRNLQEHPTPPACSLINNGEVATCFY